MKAFFTRAENSQLGLRFEPETFEEQLLLEMFTKHAFSSPHEFQFSSWEHNQPRTMREGLTSCWGQLIQRSEKRAPVPTVESPQANGGGATAGGTVPRACSCAGTARKTRRVCAPVGVRCRLCKLDADPGDGGAFQLTAMYGGERHGDEGNELVPLWRRSWLCEGCIKAIIETWCDSAISGLSR